MDTYHPLDDTRSLSSTPALPLQAVLELLPVMARLSKRNGECMEVNQAWLVATGRFAGEELGMGWLSSVHPDDRATVLASFDQQSDDSSTGFARSFRLRTRDGGYSTVRERDVWHFDASREPVEALSVGSISDGVLNYEELQSWGHELRGTLNTIVGWTELVHSGLLSPDDVANGVQTIRRAARQHAETIGNLVESVRLREDLASLDVSTVSLGEIFTRAIRSLPPEIPRERIRLELPDEEAWVAVDSARAERAFTQVLLTLVHACPESASLVVRVRVEGDLVHVEIDEDVPTGSRPRVIQELPNGALGRYLTRLAYARSFISGAGGRIELTRVGEALAFRATLPHSTAPAAGVETTAPTLSGLRVLLVDDDAEARRVSGQMLTSLGALVTTAASAREARDILDHEPIVDVLVSDIAMPDEDGYDFLRTLRGMPDARARIPAVALTSFAGASTERRTRTVGFQRCLFKPVEARLLASTIQEVWRDRHS